jgi:hypothetical protein
MGLIVDSRVRVLPDPLLSIEIPLYRPMAVLLILKNFPSQGEIFRTKSRFEGGLKGMSQMPIS